MTESVPELIEKTGFKPFELAEHIGVSLPTIYRWMRGEIVPKPIYIKQMKELSQLSNRPTRIESPRFTFVDLFAGIGGFRKAFDEQGGQCVFTSEWDKYSRMTYQANYECDHPLVGDIRDFTGSPEALERIPKHDVLLAGFPCQPFSLAGVSKKNSLGRQHGFKDETQGTLFFDIAQILEYHQPKAFLLENVKNLKSHDKGKTFFLIKKTLEEDLGYSIHTRIIDGSYWVPQHRERIFIVGFKKNTDFDFSKLKFPENSEPILREILHSKSEMDEPPYFEEGKVGSKYTLTPRLWEYLQEYRKKHEAKGNGFGFGLVGPDDRARTLSARYHKDGSEILIRQRGDRPRRLTPRECARLMGFDRPGESNFNIPVSDTQAYRQFGNSVIVPVVREVASLMLPSIMQLVGTPDNALTLFEDQVV